MRLLGKALTFDDILLVPAFSQVLPRDTSLATRLSRNITLNLPLVSAAMDTVTEARLAITIAQEGGIGIVHKNLTPKQQAAEVARVKRYESGVLRDPITISPGVPVRDVIALSQAAWHLGLSGRRRRPRRRHRHRPRPALRDPPRRAGARDHDAARAADHGARERDAGRRQGADAQAQARARAGRQRRFRAARPVSPSRTSPSRPIFRSPRAMRRASCACGAAVGVGEGTEERVDALVKAGVDVLVVDTAHGHSAGVIERVRWVKQNYPQVDVIGGNIATGAAARALADAGADGVKVGIGPGSICTTRIVAGVGVPQITAIDNVATALAGSGVPLIADGGIRYSGDIAKAIAAGAHTVMMGGMFAGTEEAPGEIVLFQGRSYKSYRGMGSIGAMQQGSADRYFQDNTGANPNADKLVPEGIEGRVPYKGSMVGILFQMAGGLRASMGYCGCASIEEMREQGRVRRDHARPAFARATSTTCRSRRKRRTTGWNDDVRPRRARRRCRRRSPRGARARQAAMRLHHDRGADRHDGDRRDRAGAAGAGRQLHRLAGRPGLVARRRRIRVRHQQFLRHRRCSARCRTASAAGRCC